MLECRPMTDREREEYLTWLRSWLAQTREEPPEEMADFFSRRVDIYEDRHLGRWGEEYAHIADCFDEKLERLLDIGCGTGLELASLYRRFPALQVTGIDLSETMLGQLRASYLDRDLRLIQADYTAWDLGEREYDGVLSFETLHHLEPEEKGALYRRVWEALTPEGVYVECDYIAATAEEEAALRAEHCRLRMEAGVGGDTLYHFDIPCTLEHQKALLEAAGFVQVTAEALEGDTVLLTARKVTPTGV